MSGWFWPRRERSAKRQQIVSATSVMSVAQAAPRATEPRDDEQVGAHVDDQHERREEQIPPLEIARDQEVGEAEVQKEDRDRAG